MAVTGLVQVTFDMYLDKEQIKRMGRRAYVDNSRGTTKVILGNDEWQLEFKVSSAIEAKTKIPRGEFSLKDVVPAIIDENVLLIREELTRMSKEIVDIYAKANKIDGSYIYDIQTRRKTDEIAYAMMNIKTYGIVGKEKTP